jgi:hypothetical protein
MVGVQRLAMGARSCRCGRVRWRDAVFEGPFGRSPGRIKFGEPSSGRAVRLHSSPEQSRPFTSKLSF